MDEQRCMTSNLFKHAQPLVVMSDSHRSIWILVPNSVCYGVRYLITNLVQQVTVDDVGRVKRLEGCSITVCSVTLVRVLTWDNAGTRLTRGPLCSHILNTFFETISRQKEFKMRRSDASMLPERGANFSIRPRASILKPDISTVWFS